MAKIESIKIKKLSLPKYKERLYSKQSHVSLRVNRLLKAKGWTRKNLAEAMDVKESSLSRMLGAIGSNLGLETISKMEVALGDDLLVTPEEAEYKVIEDLEKASKLQMIAVERAIRRPFAHRISNLSLDTADLPPESLLSNAKDKFAGIVTEGSSENKIISSIFDLKSIKTKTWPKQQAKR